MDENGADVGSNGSRGDRGVSAPPDAAPRSQRNEPASPRLWLQPFLLLAVDQWQSHGYELIRRLSTFGFEVVDRGSVYRTLRHLERDGLVLSGWDTSKEGPARRLYSLTDAGRACLEMWAGSLRAYQSMLDNFFEVYPPPDQPPEHSPAERSEPR